MNRLSTQELTSYKKFVDKANRGETVTVAYLGGSITVGAATFPLEGVNKDECRYSYTYDVNRESWRALTFQWMKDTFEKRPRQFRQVNAAIGGTGSIFGAFRAAKHLLEQRPDFLFIEFAVNDDKKGKLTRDNPHTDFSIYRTYTSIISQVKNVNPEIAMFIPVSTFREDTALFEPDDFNIAAEETVKAANLFCIPYTNIGDVFYRNKLPDGVEKHRLFDGEDTPGNAVHPSPQGHKAYAAGVIEVLGSLFRKFTFDFEKPSIDDLKPYPEHGKLYLAESLYDGIMGWELENLPEREVRPVLDGYKKLASRNRQAAFTFVFEGSAAGIWFDLESTSARMDVIIDGKMLGVWQYNAACKDDFVLSNCTMFAAVLEAGKQHVLKLIPSETQNLKEGCEFCIGIIGAVVDCGLT
ncbi:MAG: hypothetical protein A2Y21_03880 [Clostridiales bacterium GWC2_40_7]|nr:MAG: hypothetical protein A2Y21_03880 [Clostridiales bacterium GWC2_40_7]